MIVHVLAVDYDGTIAERGSVSPTTAASLARVRASGRKCVLVTGRMLPDLRRVCPEVDAMFDAVVAENGALLYLPARREVRALGNAPEPTLVDALSRRGVRHDLGTSIVASDDEYAEAALAAIRETGVERSLVFNKGSLMLLPGGVTKGTGLTAALETMELSPHNLVGIGDAENDHAFLALCECAVAVADAVPALRERADHVTSGGAGAGVAEFVEGHLLADAADVVPRLARHQIPLGQTPGGEAVTVPAHATGLLIVGPSATGKSTLTGVLVERLIEAGRAFCLLDPEGDHDPLVELPGVVALGGTGRQTLPGAEELRQLLRQPACRLVLNLSGLSMSDKVSYATHALGAVAAVRSASGLPHWLIVDEAHHIAPADGSSAVELLPPAGESLALITLSADRLARAARRAIGAVASTDVEAFREALATLRADRMTGARLPDVPGGVLERGEAVLASLTAGAARVARFEVARRQVEHRRHVRKYAEGELPPDRSFYFRGPRDALNLRAVNLKRFCELAEGVDEATWTHHLGRREYSAWMRAMIKDRELAEEVAAVEASPGEPAESRRRVLEAVRRRYSV
ncbi:MAG TPA: HAD hydrolase family protein [Methylomirabilota bacterium]|nr:HAD hydrolase family protein [Methylomirabilota bacterium]